VPSALGQSIAFLRNVEYISEPQRDQVILSLNRDVRFISKRLISPDRVYVDLLDVAPDSRVSRFPIPVNDTLVNQIRMGADLVHATTRIVLDLKAAAEFSVVQVADPPRLIMVVGSQKTDPEPVPTPQVAQAPVPDIASISARTRAAFPPLEPTEDSLPVLQSPPLQDAPEETVPPAQDPPRAVIAGLTGVTPIKRIEEAAASVRAVAPVSTPAPGGTQPGSIRIPKVLRPPRLEDFLNGAPREAEAAISDFRQREPGDGTPVSQRTSAYLSYDDDNIYIAFVCRDAPGAVRAHLSKREEISNDDTVAVYLDTFRDRQHAYYFATNPLGIQLDGLVTQDSDPDSSFDTTWHSEGKVTAVGYIVLIALPFKSLRFSSGTERTWGIALSRTILRAGETAFWPYVTKRKASLLDQLGRLEGLDPKSSGHNVQLTPYGTFTGERALDPSKTNYQSLDQVRGGLDSKFVLHNSLTVDLTLNPDFSQVESDDPQVTVNQRYKVYFPEKRPFFLDSSGYFSTPINLFFSRQIVDPEFGARVTGKIGKWSLGILGMDDRAPGEILPATDPHYGEHATNVVARVERDFGNQSEVGVMTTSSEFGQSSNRLISFDTRIKLSPTWFFSGQIVRSYDNVPSTGGNIQQLQGKAYNAKLAHSDRHWSYSTSYLGISPDFNAQLGFIQRTDIRTLKNYLGYIWRPESSVILDYGLSATITTNVDRQGVLQDRSSYVEFDMDFARRTGFSVNRYDAYERYLNIGFEHGATGASFYMNRWKWLYAGGSYSQGTGINYDPAAGVQPFLGASQIASLTLAVMPKPRIRIEQTYYYSRLGTLAGFALSPSPATVFVNHLSRTKLNYQFTPRLSVRGILDYDPTLSNLSLFESPAIKPLTGDVLVTYLINPGTAFYLGYDSRYQNLAFDPTMPQLAPRYFGPPINLTSRQFFVKLSYQLRF
jgi:hypothetical protein